MNVSTLDIWKHNHTVKNNSEQNPARIWITPHYAVIAGYPSDGFASILELEENPEISGF